MTGQTADDLSPILPTLVEARTEYSLDPILFVEPTDFVPQARSKPGWCSGSVGRPSLALAAINNTTGVDRGMDESWRRMEMESARLAWQFALGAHLAVAFREFVR